MNFFEMSMSMLLFLDLQKNSNSYITLIKVKRNNNDQVHKKLCHFIIFVENNFFGTHESEKKKVVS